MIRGSSLPRRRRLYEVSRATASFIGQPARGMPSNFTLSENRVPGRSGRPPLTPLPGARLPAGNIPDTAAPLMSQALPQTQGRAGVPKRGWGGGCQQKGMGSPAKAREGWSDMDYGVRGAGDRGGGTSSPSPSAPPPRGDIPTVQYPGRITGKGRARLPTGSTPDTAAHQVSPRIRLPTRYHPGYGFPPGIATHGPRPQGATRS